MNEWDIYKIKKRKCASISSKKHVTNPKNLNGHFRLLKKKILIPLTVISGTNDSRKHGTSITNSK